MPYPTVKSDPYTKGKPPRRRRKRLWPEAWWKQLCEQARRDCVFIQPERGATPQNVRIAASHNRTNCRDISENCLAMIADFNRRLDDL